MTALRHEATHRVLAVLLGTLFVVASVDKILHPADFARIVYRYQIIGPSQRVGPLGANLLAVTLPWVELVTGVLLVAGLWRREAAMVALAMTLVFVVAIASVLLRGIDLEHCGCLSVTGAGRAFGLGLLLEDLVLVLVAGVLGFARPTTAAAVGR